MPPGRRDLVVAGVARLLLQIAGVVTQTYLLYISRASRPGGAWVLPRGSAIC